MPDYKSDCSLCRESFLMVGDKTPYGAIVLHKEGDCSGGWFATLSPKTGGDPEKDFTVQIMPLQHIQHIAQISKDCELSKNYGLIIAKASSAIHAVMRKESRQDENEEGAVRIGLYGKSKHPDEHFHLKLFPWTNHIGQPYTVDTTFENAQVFKDPVTGEEYVKMKPVRKVRISDVRLLELSRRLIGALNEKI